MSIKALRKILIGAETTAGTAVPATTHWRGTGMIEDNRETVFVEEDIGYISGIDRTVVTRLEGRIEFDDTPATYEQLPYILMAGIKTVAATADGAGAGYIADYDFGTTAANSIKTYTVEGGDDQQAEEIEYGFVEAFSLSGAAGEPVNMNATFVGRQVSLSTFTATATVPTVEEVIFGLGKLYIDAVSGTIGTTLKSNSLMGFTLDVDTGWRAVYSADGQLYFGFAKQVMPEVTLEVTFEHNATAVAEKAAWRAQTARQIRLIFEGTSFTAGTSYSKKTLRIDLAGKWESFDKIDEMDGNDVVTGTFRARYNSTAALFAKIRVVNKLAALP
jgi:hypothetical protein